MGAWEGETILGIPAAGRPLHQGPVSGGEAGRAFLYREESAGPGRVGSGLRRAGSDQVREGPGEARCSRGPEEALPAAWVQGPAGGRKLTFCSLIGLGSSQRSTLDLGGSEWALSQGHRASEPSQVSGKGVLCSKQRAQGTPQMPSLARHRTWENPGVSRQGLCSLDPLRSGGSCTGPAHRSRSAADTRL